MPDSLMNVSLTLYLDPVLVHTIEINLPYGTLGPEGLLEIDIAAVYDIVATL